MKKLKSNIKIKYCYVNNLYVLTMSQKLTLGGFKCVEETCQFNEDFIKSYNEDSDVCRIFS